MTVLVSQTMDTKICFSGEFSFRKQYSCSRSDYADNTCLFSGTVSPKQGLRKEYHYAYTQKDILLRFTPLPDDKNRQPCPNSDHFHDNNFNFASQSSFLKRLKRLLDKETILVNSIFSFFHNVFFPGSLKVDVVCKRVRCIYHIRPPTALY